jgi:anti-sigma B factor antagonist
MKIRIDKKDSLIIIFVSGDINAVTCEKLQEKIDELITNGNKHLLLDLAEVDYISSAGLRIILATAKRLYNSGIFAVSRPKPTIREILEMVGLANIIAIYDTLEAARKNLKK